MQQLVWHTGRSRCMDLNAQCLRPYLCTRSYPCILQVIVFMQPLHLHPLLWATCRQLWRWTCICQWLSTEDRINHPSEWALRDFLCVFGTGSELKSHIQWKVRDLVNYKKLLSPYCNRVFNNPHVSSSIKGQWEQGFYYGQNSWEKAQKIHKKILYYSINNVVPS